MAMEPVQTPPAPLRDRTEMEIPAELEALVLRCLAKEPHQRPQSARELSRLLAALPMPAWSDEHAEEWWRVHMPARAQLTLQEPSASLVE